MAKGENILNAHISTRSTIANQDYTMCVWMPYTNYSCEAGIFLVVDRPSLAIAHVEAFIRGNPEAVLAVELDEVGVCLAKWIVSSHASSVVLRGKHARLGKADIVQRDAARRAEQVDTLSAHRSIGKADHYARDNVGIMKPPNVTWRPWLLLVALLIDIWQ